MKIVVTGGCGFIGRKTIESLLKVDKNTKVRILDNETTCSRHDLSKICEAKVVKEFDTHWNDRVSLMVDDIRNQDAVLSILQGADAIIHLAANTGVALSVENPHNDCVINVLGTLNVLEACRRLQIKRLVFASSGAPLGEQTPPLHEELAPHPASPYGASKLAGEGYCSAYFHSFGVETCVLRFGNVYGPGSGHKSSVVAKFMRKALTGEDWEVYGDGSQTRDFIFIDDLVSAIAAALVSTKVAGETFQIATNHETSISELANVLSVVLEEVGVSVPKLRFSKTRVGDVARNFSNTDKAKRLLNWEAEVNLHEGLKKTLTDFTSIL
ncbi:GDP-mannose 4,6-dehydratase [Amylibacter sp.]|nr:GDP-mannose 4,6-dehydratase [Amylibacter sp.]